MIGDPNEGTISIYQPTQEVVHFTSIVQKDYDVGSNILHKEWVELNNRTVIDDENRGQMMINAFVDNEVADPSEDWKWRGTRSMARNKAIVMHANLTGNFLLPMFVAQNDNDDVDRDFSEVMRDIIEWMAQPTNSNYQSSFLQVVFGMLSNPVTYLGAEYCEVFQKIREKKEDGSYDTKEILDEVLSGFHAPIWSSSQILITNAFERNLQKQRRIIKRRYVEKSELKAKWGEHANWPLVQEGIKSIYSEEDGLFYDVKDNDLANRNLVAEETALSRRDDSEVTFLNGIYFGNENIEDNPITHRDNRNAPKYNVVPFGYSRIGEHFFYYKSMMNCVGWDNMLYDAMSEVVMNRALLEVEMPVAISGADSVDSDIIFPNSVVSFEDPNTKVQQLLPNSNMAAGFNALRETEKSINEGTVNETVSGQLPEASQKAFSVAQAQAGAKKLIGAVGKSLAESVVQIGDLMKDIALNNITAPQVDELVGGKMRLKYRSFVLGNKSSKGRAIDKKIVFDESLIGMEMTDAEKEKESIKLLEGNGYPEEKYSLRKINPEFFANKFKYLSKVDVEEMFTKSQEYWQPVLSQLYAQLRQDPLVKGDVLLRKLLYSYFQSGADELVNDQPLMAPGQVNLAAQPAQGGTNKFAAEVDQRKLSTAASGVAQQ